jgi:putative FmdB family regulatory protein
MPLYEYQCESCGAVEELLVSRSESDNPGVTCEDCGGKLKRIFSTTAGKPHECGSCATTSCAPSG